jgi:sensor domain CHASE-containing protein
MRKWFLIITACIHMVIIATATSNQILASEENRLRRQVEEELTIKKSEMDEFRAELDSLKGILKG